MVLMEVRLSVTNTSLGFQKWLN